MELARRREVTTELNDMPVCFYTGEKIFKTRTPKHHGLTVEHLLPKWMMRAIPDGKKKILFNNIHRVHAMSIVNTLIGHAPIRVKFDLKKYMTGIQVLPFLSYEDKAEVYAGITKSFIDGYRVDIGFTRKSKPVWCYFTEDNKEIAQRMKEVYFSLLTEEEKILLDILQTKRTSLQGK